MSKITKYVPSWFSGNENEQLDFEFNTTDELFKVPFVKSVIDKGYPLFVSGNQLMVTFTDNKDYLLGYLESQEKLDLPYK